MDHFVDLITRYAAERQSAGEWPAEQRLLAALSCQPADVVPVCLPGFDLFRWADATYQDLLPAIARYTDPIYETAWGYDPIGGLADIPVREDRLSNGDLRHCITTPLGDLTEVIRPASSADGSISHGRIKWWIEAAEDVRRFLALPWQPSRRDTRGVATTREKLGGHALTIISVYEPLQAADDLMGTETLCLLSSVDRPLLQRLLDSIFERIMAELRFLLAEGLGPVFRVAGSELAIPPLMSLKQYEAFAFPYEREMADVIHAAGRRMILHCHGNINRLLERFADAGADGVDPCEPPPIGGIDLADAARRVGGRLSLWGNIEYNVLSEAAEAEIERLVRQAIENGAPGGGFVLLPSCRLYENPLPDKTKRNLFRLIEVSREYRKSS